MSPFIARGARLFPAGCALVFLLAHVPYLASTLEDIDSVNFALALRHFDVAQHRPHPPGYPVFVAAGKAIRPAVQAALGAGASRDHVDARTLAILAAVCGALLAFPLLQSFRMLGGGDRVARAATVVTLACPLAWVTASRPLSDTAGLLAATVAVAVLLTAWRRQQHRFTDDDPAAGPERAAQLLASGRLIVLGALLSGVAIGVRSQAAWLTIPVLLVVIVDRAGRAAAGAVLGASVTFTVGVIAWLVPLVVASGGPATYLRALSSQAGEDISGVDLLATNLTVRRLAFALGDTFVGPWESWALATVVLACAAIGLGVLVVRARPVLVMLAAMALPYAVFHLAFQETFTTRYALPLVAPVAYLAMRGVSAFATRATWVLAGGVAAASLVAAVPPLQAYARAGSPLARAIADLPAGITAGEDPLAMHYSFALALRDERWPGQVATTPKREWEAIARRWLAGASTPVQFLADPRRTDLAVFDPASRRVAARYRWPFDPTRLLGGVRPGDVDRVVLAPPGWVAGRGSALTPELAGMSGLDGVGPAQGGVTFWARRRPDAVTVMVGGRNLGRSDAPEVRFDLSIDGRPVRGWRVRPQPGFFLEMWTLEAGALAGDGEFARLLVTAEAADGSRRAVNASVEQFDLQPLASVVYGFDAGWHEREYAPATGLLWRWTTDAATVRLRDGSGPIRCRVRGESPLRYFEAAPRVTLRAGGRVVAELRPESDFVLEKTLSADGVRASGGVLTLATDRTFVPDERTGNGDRRRLGLRIFEFSIEPAR